MISDVGTYDEIAEEYYDSERHPTSANLRAASCMFLRRHKHVVAHCAGRVCELGAGRSVFAADCGLAIKRPFLIDISIKMLRHSHSIAVADRQLLVGDVLNLPIRDASVACVVSSLGDPYNGPQLWQEVNRVLESSGTVLYTTPAYEWAMAYRALHGDPSNAAEFDLRDGRAVQVPSTILEPAEQVCMFESVGFEVAEMSHVTLSMLTGESLSPKLKVGGPDLPIVTGFRIEKRQGR